MSFLIILWLFVFGLIMGSFIGALVWRLGKQLDDDGNYIKQSSKDKQRYSIIKGRSMCDNCQHKLAAKDLVPLFSWLTLNGKCRYCHKPISFYSPLLELCTAILFVLSYTFWPYSLIGAEWLLFVGYILVLVCLITMAIYDIKYTILPSRLIYTGIIIYTITFVIYSLVVNDFYRLNMAFAAAILFFLIFISIFMLSYLANKRGFSSKDWLGFGDVRLAFLLGFIVGEPILVFLAMFSASIIGIIFTMPSLINKKTSLTSQVPFGPFLIAGTIVTFWWGNYILDWYSTNMLGL